MIKLEYNEAVTQYEKFTNAMGLSLDLLRLESHIESMLDWSLVGDLELTKSWFLEQKENCSMTITDIPLSECKGWKVNSKTGWIQHDSGEFFMVQGVRVGHSSDREVKGGWDQPILTQVGFNGGLLGLLRQRIDGIPHYLVEAKAEPGNPDKIQISPSLQATFSNLKQAHGGKKPRLSEFFEFPEENHGTVLFSQWMSEDGGRLHLKRNKGMLVELPSAIKLEISETYRWVSLFQLKELIKQNSWVNPHIRGIISHL
jgi:oxidase EvaA